MCVRCMCEHVEGIRGVMRDYLAGRFTTSSGGGDRAAEEVGDE